MMTVNRSKFIAALPKGGRGVEVGVWEGDFSQQALDGCEPEMLYLVDPWEKNNDATNYTSTVTRTQKEIDEVWQFVVDKFSHRDNVTVTRMRSVDAAAAFATVGQQFDWVYVDGIHSYEAVHEDLAAWWPNVRAGGMLTGHDLDKIGVRLAVLEFAIAHAVNIECVGNNYMMTKPAE